MVVARGARLALVLLVVVFLTSGVTHIAFAQTLRFSVDRNVSRVYVNRDASIEIEYWLQFTALPGGDPITIVDVGMPSRRYDLASITADIGGAPVSAIRKSEVVDVGVEVHLGSRAIRSGQTATLHLRARVADRVLADSQDSNYASIEFIPTWFDPDSVRGTTYLETSIVFPEGVQPNEPRYHQDPFTSASIQGDRVVYTWVRERARPDGQYKFGASFPRRYVDRVATQPLIDLDPEALVAILGGVALVVGFVVLSVVGVVAAARSARRRRLDYLPPTVSVEGVEVRRGLTAPEAAVLMEQPLDKVLTLIAFGLVRKRALRVLSRKPLRLEALNPTPADLQPYESRFLAAIGGDGRPSEPGLREAMVELVNGVSRKMRGFSQRATVSYYRSIIEKAWERVQSDTEADLSEELLGETIEWTAMDEKFEERAPVVLGRRRYRRPIWWYDYFPGPRVPPTPTPAPTSGGGGGLSLPEVSLPPLPGSEAANSIVTGLQGFANNIVENVEGFTAGVTDQTNPPPPPPQRSSGGGWSGGGGCACACACAGCACACAGGGR